MSDREYEDLKARVLRLEILVLVGATLFPFFGGGSILIVAVVLLLAEMLHAFRRMRAIAKANHSSYFPLEEDNSNKPWAK
ncbi:MAG TPA: hypothetical protein VK737_03770 [Opitutales bacterium]|jgi:hypothetical protein|nr:hypothetical protein [Opitutales bacterium]